MSEEPPLSAKQIRKIKRKNEKQQIENYKTEISQLNRCEFSGLTEAQRTYLREYALEIGKIPRLSGPASGRVLTVETSNGGEMLGSTRIILSEKSIRRLDDIFCAYTRKTNAMELDINEWNEDSKVLQQSWGGDMTIPPSYKVKPEICISQNKLPVSKFRHTILDTIEANQVCVISGATGSGKTTQVPQFLLKLYAERSMRCRIVCTQPRRLAATSIAKRVAYEVNESIGQSIGYQIRLDSQISPGTNLIYTTSGFLLRCLTGSTAQSNVYEQYTHLILDEVHEHDMVTDFMLISIRDALTSNTNMKVILMSATLNSTQLSAYFGNCPVVDVPGKLFDVDISFLDALLLQTNYQPNEIYNAIDNGLEDEEAARAAKLAAYEETRENDDIDHDLLTHVLDHIDQSYPHDESILVFLPGYIDILAQNKSIEAHSNLKNHCKIFMLHSSINEGNNLLFKRPPNGKRKIILSTNIAETSLTIDDVVHVVDTGKMKLKHYNASDESTCLATIDISQACAKQRAGRAGRTRNGFCYRLYTEDKLKTMLEYTIPEIQRSPLTEICLKAKILASDLSIETFLAKAIQPPPVKTIHQCIQLLKRIGALDNKMDITSLGRLLVNMPIDCQLGKMVLYAVILQCLEPVLIIASALSVKEPFILPVKSNTSTEQTKKEFSQQSISDHKMLLNVFNSWSCVETGREVSEFIKENFIHNENMKMIDGVRNIVMRYLQTEGFLSNDALNKNSKNWSIIKGCLAAGLYPNVCRVSKLFGEITSKSSDNVKPHVSSVALGDDNLFNMKWLVYGQKSSNIKNKKFIHNITPVSSVCLLLFAGNTAELEQVGDHDALIKIDEFTKFMMDSRESDVFSHFNSKFRSMIERFFKNHRDFQYTDEEEELLKVLADIVSQEDDTEQISKRTLAEALSTNQ